MHCAAEITSDQLHFPREDAKLIETLIDYNGQPELQTYKVKFFKFQSNVITY